jgi:glutaredoxin 3
VYLREKGIEFEERNITTDVSARRELMKKGIRGVPAFLIGDQMVVGLDTEKIEELLDYIIINCPECSSRLRLPKNKGRIVVSCPKCKNEFKITT